jgi:alpha-glucosidase
MKLLPILCCVLSFVCSFPLAAQKIIRLASPNGNIIFSFHLANKMAEYAVSFKGKPLVENSPLSLSFLESGEFKNNLKANPSKIRAATEDYQLVVGKTKIVHDQYRELSIPLEETISPFRQIILLVRAFDDGIAFRYEIPLQKNWSSYSLTSENSAFRLSGNPKVHTLFRINYTTSHEGQYSTLYWNEVKPDTLMDMPTLFEFPEGVCLAITEAALVDYAGMYLVKHDGLLSSSLSPLPGQSNIRVKAQLPHNSPWRVLMISDRIGALIESNILTDLNEPCKIKDPSWIKPGKTTFPWWNGNVLPDTINAPGNNFVTAQYYIDFCARNGLQYHSVVEYGLHQWYMDDGVGFQPGPHSDVTTPVPGLDMAAICKYAKQKNVGVRVWVHWAALYPKLDSAFALFEAWGLEGMMVDFMDRDDQLMVNMQIEILQKAAAHHLHIQFHGAYKPTGLSRTWPNELTREGTLNYEADKWNDNGISPDHDINMPFTRMLAGSTDYHLGGFRAVSQSKFRAQYTRPLVLGTRCHMLAMYVVLENYLGMVCDYPEAYEGQQGFEFIKEVPTVWDQTKVLNAAVCQFITIARRSKDDWFVGSITNHQARDLTILLDFLPEGQYTAEIYSDASDAGDNPNHLTKQTRTLTRSDSLTLHLASGGGQVIHLKKN